MSKTSTAVKTRYNNKVYDKITVAVPKELAATFRDKCKEKNASQAGIVKKAIEDFCKEP